MRHVAFLAVLALIFAGCTAKEPVDSDKDGLEDGDEMTGWDIHVETPTDSFDRRVVSDPDKDDTDGDGVGDLFEFALGLDPNLRDTDEDGLTDCQEARHTVVEECEDPAWDGQPDGGYKTDGALADSDGSSSRYVNGHPELFGHRKTTAAGLIERGDGVTDGDEVMGIRIELPNGASRTVRLDPLRVDTDGDFLEDGEEIFIYGTDPLVKDTDGDGCEDGSDLLPTVVDHYDIGLESFVWETPGEGGSTEIVLMMAIADRQVFVPEEGEMPVSHSQTVTFEDDDTPPQRPPVCSYEAVSPWIRIDLQVARSEDGQYAGPLDIHSQSVPGGVSIWWNVRDDTFSWEADGMSFTLERPIEWRGEDGAVTFSPKVVS